MSKNINSIKKVEGETLKTFQEELPSQYFSHKSESEYRDYVKNAEFVYRELFKFPPQMFRGAELIDFGAGTGENTVYLANWGAKCTLVEMNPLAQNISKEVFKKYTKNFDDHKFILSSIFDYNPTDGKQYDIVHCRGVLSHTAANEVAFSKIAKLVKPGGFLIFGDPNKAGGFQNMLQRFAVYHFASTPDEMADVSEFLFKEDIDRSVKFIPRTRRAIIFDRWVIQSQDDPSVTEVMSWMSNNGLRSYSAYPSFMLPLLGDSAHHKPKFDPTLISNPGVLAELVWMLQTDSDSEAFPKFTSGLNPFATAFANLTSYVANLNKNTKIDAGRFQELSQALAESSESLDFFQPLRDKLLQALKEADEFVGLVEESDLKNVRNFIENTKVLFRGACGVRHADFIAYKPTEDIK
ncbi:MAG: class I SAM-dependent methyltransferase [bacterium]|nr:class I SAM-dependent methyltransferase [bacterium]